MFKKSKRKKQSAVVAAEQTPADALTPIVMVGATWAATKVAELIFKGVTGKQPPTASDDAEQVWKIAFWTGVVTASVTMAEVAVRRFLQATTNSSTKE